MWGSPSLEQPCFARMPQRIALGCCCEVRAGVLLYVRAAGQGRCRFSIGFFIFGLVQVAKILVGGREAADSTVEKGSSWQRGYRYVVKPVGWLQCSQHGLH